MNVLDLFSGVGGFSLGFRQANFRIRFAIDFEKRLKKTFQYNFPETKFINKNIFDLNPFNFKNKGIDVIIGSPPCKDFSIANSNPNKEDGIALVNEFLRWIKIIKPKYWLMENVKNSFLTIKRNAKYKIPRLKEFNSANLGVPQERIRVFGGNYLYPEQNYYKIKITDLLGNTKKRWITVKESIGDIVKIKPIQDLKPYDYMLRREWKKRYKPLDFNKPSTCIRPKNSEHHYIKKINYEKSNKKIPNHNYFPDLEVIKNNENNDKIRRLSIRECARLQSFPDNFLFFGSISTQYQMIGNSVPPKMAYEFAKKIYEEEN